MSQIILVALSHHISMIHFNIILPSAPRSSCFPPKKKNSVRIFFTRIRATYNAPFHLTLVTTVMSGVENTSCSTTPHPTTSSRILFLPLSINQPIIVGRHKKVQVLQLLLKLQVSWLITPCRLTVMDVSKKRTAFIFRVESYNCGMMESADDGTMSLRNVSKHLQVETA
jgi:hypothetical protein